MCSGLAETKDDTNQDHIDQVVVGHLSIGMKYIDIVQGFLDSSCLLEITNLVKSPVWLVIVTIVLPNGVLDFFLSYEPMLVILPPFQCICFCI